LSSTAKKDITKFWTVTGERPRYSSELPRENKSEYQELFLDILARGLLQTTSAAEYKTRLSQLFIDRTDDPLLWEHFAERKERQDAINRRNEELREQRYAERRERWLREGLLPFVKSPEFNPATDVEQAFFDMFRIILSAGFLLCIDVITDFFYLIDNVICRFVIAVFRQPVVV